MFTMYVLIPHSFVSALLLLHHFVVIVFWCCMQGLSSKDCTNGCTFEFRLQKKGCSGRNESVELFDRNAEYIVIRSFKFP